MSIKRSSIKAIKIIKIKTPNNNIKKAKQLHRYKLPKEYKEVQK
jgi:hypothetical protein